jgi:hypothetical protein
MHPGIDIPNAQALQGVEVNRRLVCLALLLAVKDRADALVFERTQEGWDIRSQTDGTWYSWTPAPRTVPFGVATMQLARVGLRRPNPLRFILRLFAGARYRLRREYPLRLRVGGEEVWVGVDRKTAFFGNPASRLVRLSLAPTAAASEKATAILREYCGSLELGA